MIRVLLAKIFVWCLRKLRVSVMIGVEINAEQTCAPKFNSSFAWYTDLEGIGFRNWKECGFCSANNITGENIAAFQMTIKEQGED